MYMKMAELRCGKLRYLVRYPEGFKESEKYPVILFLHGAGSRGDDFEKLKFNPYFIITEKHTDFPFITVAPLCSENSWFDLLAELKQLVIKTISEPFVDEDRIYVMGVSMGGYGTWQLAMSMPECFAAIVPICGGGMYWNAGRLINVPVWAFHGAKDQTVFAEESEKMVKRINECGGNAKLTIYPENTHDAWSDTYANPDVFAWLLEHKNENVKTLVNKYDNQEIYG